MQKQYGSNEGKRVYFASIVKGTLKGAEGKGGTGKLVKAKRTYAKAHKSNTKKFNGGAYAAARKKHFGITKK